ncbi:MAG: iron ABC transporter permease, partial [Chloroflexi bacterium]
ALGLLLLITVITTLSIGSVNIPAKTVLETLFKQGQTQQERYNTILMEIRLPRIILCSLVGSALATSGCAMQGLFRNPMASPYILGISSGAAFGASLAIVLTTTILIVPAAAFLFAVIAVFSVYHIAKVGNRVPMETLLLAGIAVGTFFTAQVSLIKYVAEEELRVIVFWLMGGFWASSWEKVYISFLPILLGVVTITLFSHELNVIVTGEEDAINLGIDVEHVKKLVLISSSMATAAAVSVSGLIGFVGLIVPHLMRLVVGPDHRILLPATGLVGATFLVWADTVARMVIQPAELPVGVVTASLGAPFFLYLLRKRRRIIGW